MFVLWFAWVLLLGQLDNCRYVQRSHTHSWQYLACTLNLMENTEREAAQSPSEQTQHISIQLRSLCTKNGAAGHSRQSNYNMDEPVGWLFQTSGPTWMQALSAMTSRPDAAAMWLEAQDGWTICSLTCTWCQQNISSLESKISAALSSPAHQVKLCFCTFLHHKILYYFMMPFLHSVCI